MLQSGKKGLSPWKIIPPSHSPVKHKPEKIFIYLASDSRNLIILLRKWKFNVSPITYHSRNRRCVTVQESVLNEFRNRDLSTLMAKDNQSIFLAARETPTSPWFYPRFTSGNEKWAVLLFRLLLFSFGWRNINSKRHFKRFEAKRKYIATSLSSVKYIGWDVHMRILELIRFWKLRI